VTRYASSGLAISAATQKSGCSWIDGAPASARSSKSVPNSSTNHAATAAMSPRTLSRIQKPSASPASAHTALTPAAPKVASRSSREPPPATSVGTASNNDAAITSAVNAAALPASHGPTPAGWPSSQVNSSVSACAELSPSNNADSEIA